jgi:hypothetical protein
MQLRSILYPLKRQEMNKKIKLKNNIPVENYITYENNAILVYLYRHDVLELLKNRINNSNICSIKTGRYIKLYDEIDKFNTTTGYVIIPKNLLDYQGYLFNLELPDTTAYSYESYWDNYVLKTKYGFEPQYDDTLNSTKIKYFPDWIITSLIIKGKAILIRKDNNEIQNKVIFRRVDLKDGHGMDDLLFPDEKYFFNVNVYSDNISPDFECLENEEIKKWIGN